MRAWSVGWLLRPRGRADEGVEEGAIAFRFKFGLLFLLPGAHGGEEQLRHVSESDGVAAGDTFVSELLDEVAEEEIHLVGGDKLMNAVEKLGGDDGGVGTGNARFEFAGVIGAHSGVSGAVGGAVMFVDGHVAMLATSVLVLALRIGVKFRGHGFYLSSLESGNVEGTRQATPHPPMFLKRYDSKGVRWWGSANDMKAKGLEAKWKKEEGDRELAGREW